MGHELSQNLDGKIADAQAPIEKLDREHQELEREANARIAEFQTMLQDLSASAKRLDGMNKWLAKCVATDVYHPLK